ncbi:coatomer protein [Paraphysoderma sedebokerense]|nr:coatomer protein [Paraphysoderma sedebokerense]
MNLSLYTVKAVLILDASNGSRVLAKYYPKATEFPTTKEQKAFEKSLWDKTKKLLNNEIILFDNQVVVYRSNIDVIFYVIGSLEENEVMLTTVLNTFYDSIGLVLAKYQIEKRTLLENLDNVALSLDECIDDGVVLETDPGTIASRVSRRPTDVTDLTLGEQSLTDAFLKARDQFISGVLLK